MKEGYRIWEIDNKTKVPKQIGSSTELKHIDILEDLDLENKTYAIRIGKNGLE